MERKAPLYLLDTVDSTNSRLKAMAREGAASGTAVAAREQTAGRGRLGREFASPPGGVYLSLLLRPDCPPARCAELAPLAAVAARRAVAACAGVWPDIKWPNDLLLEGKKICGILTERLELPGDPRGAVIIGVGINGNTRREDFPLQLRELAGSLYTQTGRQVDLDALSDALLRELDSLYAAWLQEEDVCLEEYRAACINLGRRVWILHEGERRGALALAVNPDYSLALRYDDGREETLRFGELSLRQEAPD